MKNLDNATQKALVKYITYLVKNFKENFTSNSLGYFTLNINNHNYFTIKIYDDRIDYDIRIMFRNDKKQKDLDNNDLKFIYRYKLKKLFMPLLKEQKQNKIRQNSKKLLTYIPKEFFSEKELQKYEEPDPFNKTLMENQIQEIQSQLNDLYERLT